MQEKTDLYIIIPKEIIRQGLAYSLGKSDAFNVFTDLLSEDDFIRQESTIHKHSVFIIDLFLADTNGVFLGKYIKNVMPETKVLIIGSGYNSYYLEKCIDYGLDGYLTYDMRLSKILFEIGIVLDGLNVLKHKISHSKSKSDLLIHDFLDYLSLSKREKEVLRLIIKGHTSIQVAHELQISPRTIDVHRSRILKKLGIYSMAELLNLGFSMLESD